MPWLVVNHTRLCRFNAVPTPLFALEVQRGSIPGQPGAQLSVSLKILILWFVRLRAHITRIADALGHRWDAGSYESSQPFPAIRAILSKLQ